MSKAYKILFKRVLSVSFCFIFFLIIYVGNVSSSETSKTFIWRIDSASTHVFILGSMHLAKQDLYPLSEVIEQSFDQSDVLAVEIDITKEDVIQEQFSLINRGIYLDGTSLKQILSSKTYDLLNKKLAQSYISATTFDNYKPWYLAMFLEINELVKLGYDPMYGIDYYFLTKAKNNKPIEELESFDYQINLFDGLSDKDQDLFLKYTILNLDKLETEISKTIDAWKTGNVSVLEDIIFSSFKEHPELTPIYQKIIYDRNFNMKDKIETYLNGSKVYFVVVGLGHVIGDKGLIQILSQEGFKVTQL